MSTLMTRIYDAEIAGNWTEAEGLREELRKEGSSEITEDVIRERFIQESTTKPFRKTLVRLFRGEELSDTTLAKALSSMLTHMLIEMDRSGERAFDALYISETVSTLAGYLHGELVYEDVRSFIEKKFKTFIVV